MMRQDADEKNRQAFRQFDHGKGYITIEARPHAATLLWRASRMIECSVALTARS